MADPMTRHRTLSVVVPAYNEAKNVEGAVRQIIAAGKPFEDLEILIVDDGSVDGTAEVAESLATLDSRVRVFRHAHNRGFAAAYETGLMNATMEYVTFVPADNEIAPKSLVDIFNAVGAADLVVPYHGTPWKRAWYRRILTWVSVAEINMLFGRRLQYYQGPTVYPTRLAQLLPRKTRGFFFITEMLVHALAANYSFVEVGLIHQERAFGKSKAVGVSNIINAERTILRLWWDLRVRHRQALPGSLVNRSDPQVEAIHR